MGTNTAGNILVADGTNFNSIAAGSLSEISSVANDDVFLAVDTSGGGLKKITRSTIVSGLAVSGAAISNIVEDTTPQLGGSLDVNGEDIVSVSNGNITLTPNGTGSVVASGIKIDATTISSDDSTQINLNENILISGALEVKGTLITTDIFQVGTHTVTGESFIDNVHIKDNDITTNATNATSFTINATNATTTYANTSITNATNATTINATTNAANATT